MEAGSRRGWPGIRWGIICRPVRWNMRRRGDMRFRDRVDYIVGELELCQNTRGSGYIGAIPREDTVWAEVGAGKIRSHGFDLNGAWSPWYTVHKIMAGLLDAYLYAGNAEALQVERRMADWTGTIVGRVERFGPATDAGL